MPRSEFAPAKINLTLEILGRRPDGYHELRSLVAFAQDVGDVLSCESGAYAGVEMMGPFADDISGSNLVDKAVAAFTAEIANVAPIQLRLQKNLPVASGIGGGSADAAAALRLLSADCTLAADHAVQSIARQLGADVPVCLKSRSVVMTGIGARHDEVSLPGELYAVLVNPLVSAPSNKTAQVFAKLNAKALTNAPSQEPPPRLSSVHELMAYASARNNDLETPARQLFPVIDVVLSELSHVEGSRLARLSGAGPTCFALFEGKRAAQAAASALTERQPGWWIKSTRLV